MLLRTLCFVVTIVTFGAVSFAQPMADKIPGDALIYVGWTGVDNMPAGFEASNLKGFLDATQLSQMMAEYLPKLTRKISQQDRGAAEGMRMMTAIGGPMWHHPSAIYFGGGEFTNPNNPKIRFAILVDAGADAASLSKALSDAIARGGRNPSPPKVKTYGSVVALITGPTDQFDALLGPDAKKQGALSGVADFTATMGQVRKDPVVAAYVDGEGFIKMLDEAVAGGRDREAKRNWPAIRDALGLQGLKHIAWAAGFDGKDWASETFMQAPSTKNGYVGGLMNAQPIRDETLAAIPKDSTVAGAFHFSPAALFHGIRALAKTIGPDEGAQFDQGVAMINQNLGIDLEKDLLEPMGNEWAYYIDPATAGSGILGISFIGHPSDSAKFEQSMGKVEGFINGLLAGLGRRGGPGPRLAMSFRQSNVGETNIHFLAVPMVSPSWAVKDGNLYMAFYPQVVAGAADQVSKKRDSIATNEKFAAFRQRAGNQKFTAFSYIDLPRTAPDSYQTLLAVSRLYLGFGDMFGLESPAMLPPALSSITPYLAPAGSVSWVDDAGLHSRHISPFPGSEALAQSGMTASIVGQNALLASILLPSLNRARETANRVKCASNMRQIGQAMLLYSNEHKSKYPDDMGTLIKTEDIAIDVFVCPSSGTNIPPNIRNGSMAQKMAWVNDQSDYVYLGKGKNNSTSPETVVVYEKMTDHNQDGINMLFGDGHVEFQMMQGAKQILQKQGVNGPKDGEL